MPFLFVDYEQGAGGERFCAGLSQSPQCEKLTYKKYDNDRTKVHDVFNQEFLKSNPKITVKKSHPTLYTIVPTHRRTNLALTLLEDVSSIRIRTPDDPDLHQRMTEQIINKVLLTTEPTSEYFIGFLKDLIKLENNKDFVKKVKRDLLNVELILLSKNKEPTPDAIDQYLHKVRTTRYQEPDQLYDLVIPYEQLVYDPEQVKQTLKEKFGITVVGDWLSTYA